MICKELVVIFNRQAQEREVGGGTRGWDTTLIQDGRFKMGKNRAATEDLRPQFSNRKSLEGPMTKAVTQ